MKFLKCKVSIFQIIYLFYGENPNSLPNPYPITKPLPFPIYLREKNHANVEIADKQKGEIL